MSTAQALAAGPTTPRLLAPAPLQMVHPAAGAITDVCWTRLSPRDREVLVLLTWGRTTQEVADELFVSIDTVRTYIHFAYQKIGVTRRAQAVAWGLRNGLSPLPTAAVAPTTSAGTVTS